MSLRKIDVEPNIWLPSQRTLWNVIGVRNSSQCAIARQKQLEENKKGSRPATSLKRCERACRLNERMCLLSNIDVNCKDERHRRGIADPSLDSLQKKNKMK